MVIGIGSLKLLLIVLYFLLRSRTPGYNNDDQRRNGDNYIRDRLAEMNYCLLYFFITLSRSRSRSRGYKNNDNRRDRYDNRDRYGIQIANCRIILIIEVSFSLERKWKKQRLR